MEQLQKIESDIESFIESNNIYNTVAIVPPSKKNELSIDQKNKIYDYFLEKGYDTPLTKEIAAEIGIEMNIIKSFLSNSKRDHRTNNLFTVKVIQEELEKIKN